MAADVKKTGQFPEMEFRDEKKNREAPLGKKNRILQLLKI